MSFSASSDNRSMIRPAFYSQKSRIKLLRTQNNLKEKECSRVNREGTTGIPQPNYLYLKQIEYLFVLLCFAISLNYRNNEHCTHDIYFLCPRYVNASMVPHRAGLTTWRMRVIIWALSRTALISGWNDSESNIKYILAYTVFAQCLYGTVWDNEYDKMV